jgi:hypothetical protein
MLICRIRSRSSPSSCWRRTRLSASSLARDLKSERSAYASSFSHSAMRRQRTRFHATCHTDRIFGNERATICIRPIDRIGRPAFSDILVCDAHSDQLILRARSKQLDVSEPRVLRVMVLLLSIGCGRSDGRESQGPKGGFQPFGVFAQGIRPLLTSAPKADQCRFS